MKTFIIHAILMKILCNSHKIDCKRHTLQRTSDFNENIFFLSFLTNKIRCQRTCESVHETARDNLRKELMEEYSTEKSNLVKKYEADCNKLM